MNEYKKHGRFWIEQGDKVFRINYKEVIPSKSPVRTKTGFAVRHWNGTPGYRIVYFDEDTGQMVIFDSDLLKSLIKQLSLLKQSDKIGEKRG